MSKGIVDIFRKNGLAIVVTVLPQVLSQYAGSLPLVAAPGSSGLQAEDAARVRGLGAGRRAGGRRIERDGAGGERAQPGQPGERPHPCRRPTRSISPYPIRLKATTASAIDTPGANTSQGATAM